MSWDQHVLTLAEIAIATLTGVSVILKVTEKRNRARSLVIKNLENSVLAIGSKLVTISDQVEKAKTDVMAKVNERLERAESTSHAAHEAMRVQIEGNHKTITDNFIGHREFNATMSGLLGSIAELRSEVGNLTRRVDSLFGGRANR